MIKILLINNGYPSELLPNYCTYIRTIEEEIKSNGYTVDLLVLRPSGNKFKDYMKFYISIILKNFKRYDLLYINHWPNVFLPLLFKNLKKKKIIINFHGSDLVSNGVKSKIINSFSKLFIPKSTKYIVPSLYLKKILLSKYNLPEKEVFTIPSGGVDTTLFKIMNSSQKRKEHIIFGFASGVIKSKGCYVLLEALKLIKLKNPDILGIFKVRIIGYGIELANFKRELQKNNLMNIVEFIDPMPKKQMVEFYNTIDCLVFPTFKESLGLVALESMACGVPAIAPNKFAFPEFILDKFNGFLLKETSPQFLYKTILLIINNRSLLENMIPKCRDVVEQHYSMLNAGKMYRKAIEYTMGENKYE